MISVRIIKDSIKRLTKTVKTKHRARGITIFLILIFGIALVASCTSPKNENPSIDIDDKTKTESSIIVYKSSACGCCSLYVKYLEKKGFNVEVVEKLKIDHIKEKYDIPNNLHSCHTTIIGDYFVEGHIPIEAVDKLMKEKPDIKGIAMPRMPSGSPGMPGSKSSHFTIYAVNKDGTTIEFMKI